MTEGSWTLSEDPGIKYFSGTAEYRKAITVPGLSADQRLILDLGDVKNIAEISIDGKVVSTLWKHPFRTDITSFVHEGDNILTVKVTNLWPNRLIGDSALGKDERITYTPTEFFSPSSPLLPSGIIGPVKIESGYWK